MTEKTKTLKTLTTQIIKAQTEVNAREVLRAILNLSLTEQGEVYAASISGVQEE